MIKEIDYFGNKKINYSEFLVATLDIKAFLDDNKLRALFMTFDTDNSGTITRENIVSAMEIRSLQSASGGMHCHAGEEFLDMCTMLHSYARS